MRTTNWLSLLGVMVMSLSALAQGTDEILLKHGLFVDRVIRSGRELARIDPIAGAMAAGALTPPAAGDTVRGPGGDRAWAAGVADEKGQFAAALGRGGYGYFEVESPRERVMVLEARSHAMVYVDGEPRMGDPYASGAVAIPVRLREGKTPLLFSMGGRANFRAVLRAPRAPVELDPRDVTCNELVEGEENTLAWIGIVIRNCTASSQGVRVDSRQRGQQDWTRVREFSLPALGSNKQALHVPIEGIGGLERYEVELRVTAQGLEGEDVCVVPLRVRRADQSRKRVYTALLDGSVQYYAEVPPMEGPGPHGMVLSLHGASVEATGQADSYARKPGLWIICPTNRRPFGFDWEAWGRDDALSVLKAARQRIEPDDTRIYLTGHSMGGHGAWQLASLFPDHFAAVAPSAGWISFESYAGARGANAPREESDPFRAMMRRAAGTSDTLAHASNLAPMGVFILHGDADDNVPVSEARRMAQELEGFHRDWRIHEEAGAGHWWDSGEWKDHAGAACVDFPPIFDFFAARRLAHPGEVRRIDFVTLNPAVSGACRWASIVAQEQRLRPSRITLDYDPARRHVRGTTANVGVLAIAGDLRGHGSLTITLDGQQVETGAAGDVYLHKQGGTWQVGPEPDSIPPGSFPLSMDSFVLIYATGGTPEETAQSLAHARFDAEQWWVRGNGAALVISDREFLAKLEKGDILDESCSIYGNAETNLAWGRLLSDSQVQVSRGSVRIGDRLIAGSAGVLAVQRGLGGGTIRIIAGTDLAGAKTLERLPIFVSGVGIPEIVVMRPDFYTRGEEALVVCGTLGNDWTVTHGDLLFRNESSPP